MNILFHCWEFPPRGSGIGAYIYQMSRALCDAGEKAVVVTSRGDGLPQEELVGDVVVYRAYEYEDIGSLKARDAVLGIALDHKVDVIEAVDHLGESASLLRDKNRPPIITKCHYNDVLSTLRYAQAFYPWQKITIDIACFRKRVQIANERFSIERCDGLIVPSQRMLSEIRKDRLNIPEKTAVIANPFHMVGGSTCAEADVPTILLVGRIDIGKGIQYLPSVIASLVKQYPGVRMELAGEDTYARCIGSIKAWLQKRLGQLSKHVVFLGKLNSQQMHVAYNRAWVVIVPSKWDTFPTVVLEAMAHGKPVVASHDGGMGEMLEGTGATIELPASPAFSDAILNLLGDKVLRNKIGQLEMNKIHREYSPEVIVPKYIKFVRSCC